MNERPTDTAHITDAEALREQPNQRQKIIARVLARRDGFYGIKHSSENSATDEPNEKAYEMADAIIEALTLVREI